MIAKKSFLIVSTHYLSDTLGFVGLVILSKLWGGFAPEALGIIGFAMSTISLFNIFTNLGFQAAHVKRISEGKDFGACLGTFIAIKLSLISIMIVVIFAALYIWKNVLHGGFYDATTESVLIIMVIYLIFTNLQIIPTQTFIGRKEIAKLQITRLFQNIVKLPLTILVALAGVKALGWAISPAVNWPEFLQPLQIFLAEHATGSLAMTYVFGVMASFFIGTWLMRGYPIKRPSLSLAKNYLSFALPLTFSSIISNISYNIDKVMIGYFWASADVGYYFAFQRIITFITILYLSVSTILFPTISKQHAEKNMKGIISTVHLAERYISMVLMPPLVIVLVFAKPAINIFLDESFVAAYSVFILLVIFTFIRGMTTPFANLINGISRPDISAKFGIVVCITNVILNYLIIPKNGIFSHIQIAGYNFGINGASGAAFSTIISFLIPFFGLRIVSKRLTGIKLLQTHTPRHIVAGFIMGGVLFFIAYSTTMFPVIRWFTLLGFSFLGFGIYIAILFVLKEFSKKDLDFFLKIINLKEMVSYIKSELKGETEK